MKFFLPIMLTFFILSGCSGKITPLKTEKKCRARLEKIGRKQHNRLIIPKDSCTLDKNIGDN